MYPYGSALVGEYHNQRRFLLIHLLQTVAQEAMLKPGVISRRFCLVVFAVASACTSATSVTGIGPSSPSSLSARQAAFLDTLERRTFNWFWERTDANTGLTPDRWPTKSFSSVAAIGFALTAYPVGVERAYVSRADAAQRTLNTLRFMYNAPQGSQPTNVTGYKGFFYHFLDMQSGFRFERVELSTIDTSLLLGGILFAQSYFTGADPTESAIRAYADSIYLRVDWAWAVNQPNVVSMGWHPESGWINADWRGYDEGMIVYVLALGSPTHSIDPASWAEWTKTYVWADFYGQAHVNFPPLFGHQYSHIWIDFRGIQDVYMRGKGIDYFENSRRATISQRLYAIANPGQWRDYGANVWGLTAGDGPFDTTLVIGGRSRQFWTYRARGAAANGIQDDGTIAPTAAGGSVAFAPEIAIPALVAMREKYGDNLFTNYGFVDDFNPTLTEGTARYGRIVAGVGWFDTDYLGIDQGPIIAMIENYRSDLIWKTMRKNKYIVAGLKKAGFTGGWLGN
ncbi:MAG TPA: glucoamylase family protein [Gemmatimonadaceae bacterium]|nr:glucoamylase family protein [Gemmatimonadaceae bacterium]